MDTSNSSSTSSTSSGDGAVPIPKAWPGAFESFKQVKPAVKRIFWPVFLCYLGIYILSIVISIILGRSTGGIFISDLVELCVEVVAMGAAIALLVSALRGDDITINVAVNKAVGKFVNMLVVLIIVEVLTIISLLLLIVPFFFVFPRLFMAPYLVIAEDLGIMEAVNSSWNMTKGHLGEIYGIVGIALLLALLSITIIGIPFAIYWGVINYGSSVQLARFLSQSNSSSPVQA